jgi:hypothetical protein
VGPPSETFWFGGLCCCASTRHGTPAAARGKFPPSLFARRGNLTAHRLSPAFLSRGASTLSLSLTLCWAGKENLARAAAAAGSISPEPVCSAWSVLTMRYPPAGLRDSIRLNREPLAQAAPLGREVHAATVRDEMNSSTAVRGKRKRPLRRMYVMLPALRILCRVLAEIRSSARTSAVVSRACCTFRIGNSG